MGLDIKTADGKTGYFDANSFLKDQVPGASVTDYDPNQGVLSFQTPQGKSGSFNVKQMLADQNVAITGHKDFNTPVSAVDSSPLDWHQRFALGYLTRESSDFQGLINGVKSLVGAQVPDQATQDASKAANEKRAITTLKGWGFDDAAVSNGNLVVKKNGVWKQVDAPSSSIGEKAAEMMGHMGLNLMGGIAGGMLGAEAGAAGGPMAPLTVPGGAALGFVAGSMLGETAKEAVATGISGGAGMDLEASGRDILTTGLTAMGSEILGAGMKVGANKIANMGIQDASKLTPEMMEQSKSLTELKTLKGMTGVTKVADSKVKDTIANVYSQINPGLNEAPLREAIDNPDNFKQAYALSKVAATASAQEPQAGKLLLQRSMAQSLQDTLENTFNAAQAKFGAVLGKIREGLGEDFKIDLEQHVTDLEAAAQDAPKDKRAFFDSLQNEAQQLVEKMKANGQEPVLSGKQAWDFNQRQYQMITNKMKSLGAWDPQTMVSDDRLLMNSMDKIRSYLDDKRLFAADHADLADGEWKNIKQFYGNVKDSMDTIWSKSFSNKRDMTFAQNIAKGSVDSNVKEALMNLHNYVPEAGIADMLSQNKLRQAGIDMSSGFFHLGSFSKSVGAGAGVGGLIGGAPGAVVGGTMGAVANVARTATTGDAKMAYGMARAAGGVSKAAVAMSLPAARAKAGALLGTAYASHFMSQLPAASASALLQNPDAFNSFVQKAMGLSQSLSKTSDQSVLNAAIQQSNQRQQQALQQGGR
jgi:hypothetical protein